MARRTAVRVTARQTPVIEQSFSEQHTLRVLGASGRDWCDRFEAGAGPEDWRLTGSRPDDIEANDQQEIRNPAPVCSTNHGRRHPQSGYRTATSLRSTAETCNG